MKRLIARRTVLRFERHSRLELSGLPELIKTRSFTIFLRNESITWKFNLSKAPWLGGQFKRSYGLTKQTRYIIVGKANLKGEELENVLLDIEVNLTTDL